MSETVIDENTGEEVPVQKVEAAATIASLNSFTTELPRGSARVIEQFMANAVAHAMESGITDPEELREIIQKARQTARQGIMNYVREHNSQVAAVQQES